MTRPLICEAHGAFAKHSMGQSDLIYSHYLSPTTNTSNMLHTSNVRHMYRRKSTLTFWQVYGVKETSSEYSLLLAGVCFETVQTSASHFYNYIRSVATL